MPQPKDLPKPPKPENIFQQLYRVWLKNPDDLGPALEANWKRRVKLQKNPNHDPEIIEAMQEVGKGYFQEGITSLADWRARALTDFADERDMIEPFIELIYDMSKDAFIQEGGLIPEELTPEPEKKPPPPPQTRPSLEEQASLFEAILRYSEIPLERGSTCFISIKHRNPSRELLGLLEARFRDERIRFRKESEAVRIPVEDGILTHKLVDPATGEDARYYCVVQIERPSPERAVVEVETLGSGQEYTLQREDGRWVVVHERTIWIA